MRLIPRCVTHVIFQRVYHWYMRYTNKRWGIPICSCHITYKNSEVQNITQAGWIDNTIKVIKNERRSG